MVQDLKLLDYNSRYLTAHMNLQVPGKEHLVTAVYLNGKVEVHDTRTDEDYWIRKYLQLFQKVHTEPWIIINGDTHILEKLSLTGEDLQAVRNKTISIFYYEPLFVRSRTHRRCPAFFDRNTDTYFPELEWQKSFVLNHGNKFKTKAFVCDYGLKDYLSTQKQYSELDVDTWDIFLADIFCSLYKKSYPFNTNIKKKFICPNFRYEGMRELIVGYLKGSPWSEEGHISFFHRHNKSHFLTDLFFDPSGLTHYDRILEGIELMQNQLPLALDTRNNKALHPVEVCLPDMDGTSNKRKHSEFHQWYHDAFLAIVNETRFSTLCGELSEKIMTPILHMRPFVVVGGPYMLRYLREIGFETFGDLWDESYDLIEDHQMRAQAILNLLDQLLSMPLDQMQKLLVQMQERLIRNNEHLRFHVQNRFHDDLKKKIGISI